MWSNHNQLIDVEAVRQAVEDVGGVDVDVDDVEVIKKYEVSIDE